MLPLGCKTNAKSLCKNTHLSDIVSETNTSTVDSLRDQVQTKNVKKKIKW